MFANFTELEQVVLNFVINAQQAIQAAGPEQGRMIIRVSDVGHRVRLEVIDNGPGVSPENEPKLFQPFFTTKPVGAGTGLGLSVSYGIIDAYRGTIGYRRQRVGRRDVLLRTAGVRSITAAPGSDRGTAGTASRQRRDDRRAA